MSNKSRLAIVIIALVIVVGGGAYWFLSQNSSQENSSQTATTTNATGTTSPNTLTQSPDTGNQIQPTQPIATEDKWNTYYSSTFKVTFQYPGTSGRPYETTSASSPESGVIQV